MGFFPIGSHISHLLCAFAQKEFFSGGPRDIECIWDLCAYSWEHQIAFLASGKAKNGFFSLRIAHIALFYTINFFSHSPEGFALSLGQCTALRSLVQPWGVNNTFFSLWEGQKWGFFPNYRTYRAFFVLLHKRNFFRMVPEGLNAFGTFVHAAESAN